MATKLKINNEYVRLKTEQRLRDKTKIIIPDDWARNDRKASRGHEHRLRLES
jgi:hypothetical protein